MLSRRNCWPLAFLFLVTIGCAAPQRNGFRGTPHPGPSPAGNALPSQTGQDGKFLTTNGSVASWASVSTANTENAFSLLSYRSGFALSSGVGTAGEVHGGEFYVTAAATGTALNFWWCDGTATTVRAVLWDPAVPSRLAQVDVATNAVGDYTATFTSTVSLTAYHMYRISYYDLGAAHRSCIFTVQPQGTSIKNNSWPQATSTTLPAYISGPHYVRTHVDLYGTGDTQPGSVAGTERYAIDPVFTVP